MARRSPTLEGFRLIFVHPSLGFAEIAWRWSFWAAGWFVALLGCREYLQSLDVNGSDMFLLSTRQPVLVSKALRHIFAGSSLRVVESTLLLALAGAFAWVVLGSLGRSATLRAIVLALRESRGGKVLDRVRFRSMIALHALRMSLFLAALVGVIAAKLAASRVTSAANPSPGRAMLVFLTIALVVACIWLLLNWFLGLASIFVVAENCNTFSAVSAALDMCAERFGAIAAVGTWYGLAHFVVLSVASSVVIFPLAFASLLPAGVVLGGVLLVVLLYCAVVDFLYVGRLAAYVAIMELRQEEPASEPSEAMFFAPQALSGRIDPDELILSDLPV